MGRRRFRQLERLLIEGALEQKIETLPLEQAAEAHRLLESRQLVGKIVLLKIVLLP